MQKYFNMLLDNPLFFGILSSEIQSILACLNAKTKKYVKSEKIIESENTVHFVYIVLAGNVQIIKEDYDGNVNIITDIGENGIFAETFACAGVEKSPVSAVCMSDCEVLELDYRKIISVCTSSCSFHIKLIENMLRLIAKKNVILSQKNEILSKRSTREKILAFLDFESKGRDEFKISFNREEMASYLCVDRSALSNELSKLKSDNIIMFNKNWFKLIKR